MAKKTASWTSANILRADNGYVVDFYSPGKSWSDVGHPVKKIAQNIYEVMDYLEDNG